MALHLAVVFLAALQLLLATAPLALAASGFRGAQLLTGPTGGRRWLLEGAEPLKHNPKAYVVPLHPRHGVSRRRGLLRAGALPIIGAVREVG